MKTRVTRFQSARERRALPVIVLGILVVVVPVLLVPSPGDGGPITFEVRLMQAIAAVIGLAVAATGVYSYRTGNLGPAMAAGTTVAGLVMVGIVGGVIGTAGGPLVPIRAWALSATLVVVSIAVTYRFASGNHRPP